MPINPPFQTNPATTRHYVVGTNGGLANVLVYVKADASKLPRVTLTNPATLGIRRAFYEPYVSALQTNQPLQLRNHDPFGHTAHIMPPAGNPNPARSLAMPQRDVPVTLAFSNSTFTVASPPVSWRERILRWLKLKPAPAGRGASSPFIRFKCDVHPWEFGHVAVFDHPFFAVTRPDGTFELHALPPGTYTVEAIHLKAGTNSQRVKLSRRGKHVTIVLNAPAPPTPVASP